MSESVAESAPAPEAQSIQHKKNQRSASFILYAGVLLPALALGLECFTQMSGGMFLDPIPSPFHALLIALVPLANALLLRKIRHAQGSPARGLAWLNAFAIGIALYYALAYLPITPVAPFMILAFGMGFLPLAPLLSLIATLRGRLLLNRWLTEQGYPRLPRVWGGLLLALGALIIVDLPFGLTQIGLQMANSVSAETHQSGLRLLRSVGNEKVLRRQCNPLPGQASGILNLLSYLYAGSNPIGIAQARTIYYQVTGKSCNDQPYEHSTGYFGYRQRAFDKALGSDAVGRPIPGISLVGSRLDGSLDANAGTAYLEWTQVYRNDTFANQEGRSKIALPPGAVVSRLTLWIDGEEHEAIFGPRSRTRQAYQKVVSRQRDPVLVTTAGKDRIMVQLFPIPPSGGEMKLRIGMTVPLSLTDLRQARLQLPTFLERNFDIAPQLIHAVWLEGNAAMAAGPALHPEQSSHHHTLRGDLTEEQLGNNSPVSITRNPEIRSVWSTDPQGGKDKRIVQRYEEQASHPPTRLALVIDGSSPLAPQAKAISAALTRLPNSVQLGLFPASDTPLQQTGAMTPDTAAQALARMDFVGGQDNLAALGQAWDWAAAGPDGTTGAILWIHGPQPLLLGSVEPLLQNYQRRPGLVRLYTLEGVPGPNKVLEALDTLSAVETVSTTHHPQQDLGRLFEKWSPGAMELQVIREQQAANATLRNTGPKTSDHLARLWAAEKVRSLLQNGRPEQQAATDLAVLYRLVTPVSGAVVLETAEQYEEAGQASTENGSVPTIPEPEEWLLILAVLCLLAWLYRQRRPLPPGMLG